MDIAQIMKCVRILTVPKLVVFQHVAHEILGTLNPLLKKNRFRVRYINFERNPDANPSLEKYDGLVILGGHMGVYEADRYKHIKVEMQLIEQALQKNIPVLGICLGSQLLAQVLGSKVRKHNEKEVGWCDVELTDDGSKDQLLKDFRKTEKIFQMHGDTFDIPKSTQHLARSKTCESQAFRYGEKVYGLQFHLEVDQPMIERWLKNSSHREELEKTQVSETQIIDDTNLYLDHSLQLSRKVFKSFIGFFDLKDRPLLLGSRHTSADDDDL